VEAAVKGSDTTAISIARLSYTHRNLIHILRFGKGEMLKQFYCIEVVNTLTIYGLETDHDSSKTANF